MDPLQVFFKEQEEIEECDGRPPPEVFLALQELLGDGKPVHDVVLRLVEAFEKKSDDINHLLEILGTLNAAVISLPQHHEKIFDFMHALQDLPHNQCNFQRGKDKYLAEDKDDWRELGPFVRDMGDSYRSCWAHRMGPGNSSEGQRMCHEEWENCNKWYAMCARRNLSLSDFDWGFTNIHDALEVESWRKMHIDEWMGNWTGYDTFRVLNADVPAAAQFFIMAGRLIYNNLDNLRAINGWGEPVGARYPEYCVWPPDPKMSIKRWEFWKERFQWVQEQESLWPRTKAIAKEAAEAMCEVERDPQPATWIPGIQDLPNGVPRWPRPT